jgi:hypothetical protein
MFVLIAANCMNDEGRTVLDLRRESKTRGEPAPVKSTF